MGSLFDVGVPAISKHLANVFETGELNEEATISKMETVQQEGSMNVKRSVVMYAPDGKSERLQCRYLPNQNYRNKII